MCCRRHSFASSSFLDEQGSPSPPPSPPPGEDARSAARQMSPPARRIPREGCASRAAKPRPSRARPKLAAWAVSRRGSRGGSIVDVVVVVLLLLLLIETSLAGWVRFWLTRAALRLAPPRM
ncbi:unnamed protein product [Prorocentrum cordatum]|uniref:Uncharacterized protein n=1 Tax=Prorocentrum cordatum TaxID=2364126 RepID=A0ABN9V326_9DINO|nr:unnamed protein product [Polarella glacialis]